MKKYLFSFLLMSTFPAAETLAQNFFPEPDGDGQLANSNAVEFGKGTTKEFNAGKIAYQKFSDALDIVGAGTTGSNRKIKLWAEGGLDVTGSININSVSVFNRLLLKPFLEPINENLMSLGHGAATRFVN